MLKLFNTYGKKTETFHPANKKVVNIFSCGPSVYQRSHIGNFRTFLFEDILGRFLEYSGYKVKKGMNLTDIEDKALQEAEKRGMSVKTLTEKNIKVFISEMNLLKIKMPDYLPKASESIDATVDIIERLLDKKIAYWYKGNVYFDPLRFPKFGKLYGFDMSKWPKRKKRFHRDTYPGMQWNLGDFILWHGYKREDKVYWDTKIGKGRPAWNIQDPGMISKHFQETLSIYCGGIDNLFRHHDYTIAILESVRPYPVARFWLHCQHLHINSQKMSKSKGNIYYTDDLLEQGYTLNEIRFFLIYGHYRERLYYSDKVMTSITNRLKIFRHYVYEIKKRAHKKPDLEGRVVQKMKKVFIEKMDNDLNIKEAFDGLYDVLSGVTIGELKPDEASGIIKTLRQTDEVFKVIF
ncbi:MAG: class I tRNA ligase family protein [Nitrospirota bacterium]|nr:class I tRNA ligase family protein [Nitrospirota bacterium]